MGNTDASFTGELTRHDNPIVLACDRHQAVILPVVMDYQAGGYKAGTVLARNTTSGYYQAYNDGLATGLNTAKGVLLAPVDFGSATSGQQTARCIFRGNVYYDKLVGIDANGVTDLGGREITDASGTNVLIF